MDFLIFEIRDFFGSLDVVAVQLGIGCSKDCAEIGLISLLLTIEI